MRVAMSVAMLSLLLVAGVLAQDEPSVPKVGNPHGNMNLDCRLCHSESSWELTGTGDFDHASTGFPLVGMHQHALCRDCHKEPEFAHVGTQCVDCHNDTHRGRLGPVCTDCHTPQAWVDQSEMRQEHNATAMPLVGAHERVDCDACHSGAVRGDYVGTPTDCYACHADTYEGTTDPDHQMAGFSTDCERCHGVFSATWGSGDFIHDQRFPLTGAHRLIECVACHADGFAGTPTDCVACHRADYDNTTDPGHVAANFPTDCAACHTTTAWEPATFDHNTTGFPLTGAHRSQDCIACHSDGYAGTPTDCVSCHRADYDNTTDPNHLASGFPTDCVACHTTTAWEPADFDHATTAFPLTGAHASQDCLACHSTGYTGTPTDCVACHRADYDNTTDPGHVAANFPTDCAACHTTTAWEPSTWDHDTIFPINSGKHLDKWNSCADCHVVQSDFSTFECIFCHEHNRTDTDDHHREVGNYQYLSAACLECHPQGRH